MTYTAGTVRHLLYALMYKNLLDMDFKFHTKISVQDGGTNMAGTFNH